MSVASVNFTGCAPVRAMARSSTVILARYFADRLMASMNFWYGSDGSRISQSDFFVAMFCRCLKMAEATTVELVSVGIRPWGCSRSGSFNELNMCATIVLSELNFVINRFM